MAMRSAMSASIPQGTFKVTVAGTETHGTMLAVSSSKCVCVASLSLGVGNKEEDCQQFSTFRQ